MKSAQTLARHSDPRLTQNIYARATGRPAGGRGGSSREGGSPPETAPRKAHQEHTGLRRVQKVST